MRGSGTLLKRSRTHLTIPDPGALRRKISAGQAQIGRAKGAKGGGNQTKRLRFFVEGTGLDFVGELMRFLETGVLRAIGSS